MLTAILRHTPAWVFVLFVVLLAFGYFQTKNQVIGRGRVIVLPVAMLALSLSGVFSAFGVSAVGLLGWTAGACFSAWLGVKLGIPRGVGYSVETRSFSVPGSWLPLALMMAIFFTKYAVGVILARELPIASEPTFVGTASLCYGLFSGVFLARLLVIRRSARRRDESCS